ncbi:helix-turn-helix domain-containing protein [Paralcaligenes sp. KSB-10]|nr:helix-turn-helix transcriptional regulator [Paralcaligenes sp. KSB-10]UHL63510.1 helix-turn-helix domain-containing protein [Paralcaligenes sp. KSB-10]
MHSLLASLVTMRKASDLTQDELARRTGLSRTTIQQTESGTTDPHFSTLFEIARALGMDIMVVPRPLRKELEWFIQAEGKCLGHPPGISAPLSIVDEIVRGNNSR